MTEPIRRDENEIITIDIANLENDDWLKQIEGGKNREKERRANREVARRFREEQNGQD